MKEYDLETAKSLMGAIGMYLVKNTVQLAYDDDRTISLLLFMSIIMLFIENRYEVPIFCINDPIEYENEADPYTIVDFE